MNDIPIICHSNYGATKGLMPMDLDEPTPDPNALEQLRDVTSVVRGTGPTETDYFWKQLRGIHNAYTDETSKTMANTKRIVRVLITDPDPKLPVEKSMLHNGQEQFTDLTDQELFFEISNFKQLLIDHNNMRKTIEDRVASDKAGRAIFLEPIKIRDLKMLVVTIAQF